MNTKAQWLDNFQQLLWQHHTCDWEEGIKNPDYPFQLAVAYFEWDYDVWGNCTVAARTSEEAFAEYLKGYDLILDSPQK